MKTEFKRVPALDKCFSILQLFAESKHSLGISEISKKLELSKSTVFNIIYTLEDLQILEQCQNGKFQFGTHLYLLGNETGKRSELIQTIHPYLVKINRETKLSAFLGFRSDLRAIIIDKADAAYDIKISSEVGMDLPLLAGAGSKALLCQLKDEEIDKILNENKLKRFTSKTCVDEIRFKKEISKAKEEGIAFDDEEYIEGVVAFAVPLKTHRNDLQVAIWAVGLKHQVGSASIPEISKFLLNVAREINLRFFPPILEPDYEKGPETQYI